MADAKSLFIDKLVIWSDNPRHGLQVKTNEFSETDIINILIDVVGEDKMYNLINDIVETKGLLPNLLPVVVPCKDKYHVYDGNRRISALKIIKNPSIIENEQLLKRVSKLVENNDTTFAEKVSVYITEENEALEIMDKMHSGEQNGVGMISWEPYQRDISLSKRNKQLQYPIAFKICQALNYDMKSFTKDTPTYTDLDRLFKVKTLTEHFDIDIKNSDFSKKVKNVIHWLEEYKKVEGFNSYSRQFNITGDKEFNGPISKFCDWVDEQKQNMKKYKFQANEISIFCDEKFSFAKFNLKIYNNDNNKITFEKKDLSVEYISPKGILSSDIDLNQIGIWTVKITYDGEQCKTTVNVRELLKPRIDFCEQKIYALGNTVDLRDLVIRATDSHGKDQKRNLVIEGHSNYKMKKDMLTGENSKGDYTIKYTFTDIDSCPFSRTNDIKIVDKLYPLLPENRDTPIYSTRNSYCDIDISPFINELIREINELDFNQNVNIIATSTRTILELTFDELYMNKKVTFKELNNLKTSIDEFKTHMLNGEVKTLCQKYNQIFTSYKNEINFFKTIDADRLASFLHLAAHKSCSRIETTELSEVITKKIVPILIYASVMLKEK